MQFTQLLRVMRITTFLIFVATLQVAAKLTSQTVTLSGKNLSLITVFAEIEKANRLHGRLSV